MSRRAWAYIWSVLLLGSVLSGLSLPGVTTSLHQWPAFVTFTVLATMAQLFKAELNHAHYYATPVFMLAGALLLHPFLFVLLVVISGLIHWIKERRDNTPLGRIWYIQPFNTAADIIAGLTASSIYVGLMQQELTGDVMWPAVGFLSAVAYLVCNHLLVGQVLVLARGLSWRESGVLDGENLLNDIILLLLGFVVAVLWQLNPWLILPAISPLVLMYRALMVPQLKQEAQSDVKTGLYNARYFDKLFNEEFNRAGRFNRPLAFVMADLDFMRNINNTYGHLAGDAVLAGIGQIIRKTVRTYDIAGRFGGEEFALALPEMDVVQARQTAERLRAAIEAHDFMVPTSPTPIHVTMSIGVACFPHDATTPTALQHEADVAVYEAKANGRNRVMCAADVSLTTKINHLPKTERPQQSPPVEPPSCNSSTIGPEDTIRMVARSGAATNMLK